MVPFQFALAKNDRVSRPAGGNHTLFLFFTSIALSAIVAASTPAQNLARLAVVGKAERVTGQTVPKDVRDANGQRCAGIIVASELKGLTYDSNNGVVRFERTEAGDLLYVSPDERVVMVFRSGYQPLSIKLPEVGATARSGEIWLLHIVGEARRSDLSPDQAHVDFTSDPPGAEVTIPEVPGFRQVTPFVCDTLTPRRCTFRIEMDKYLPIDTSLQLNAGVMTSVRIRLSPTHGYVIFQTVEGTSLSLDGYAVSFNPGLPIELPAGRHQVVASRSHHKDIERDFDVIAGTTTTVWLTMEKGRGKLTIETSPPGATLSINGIVRATTPRTDSLDAGDYTIQLVKSGYREEVRTFTLESGDHRNFRIELVQNGVVDLFGTQGATVLMDDSIVGRLPMHEFPVIGGIHTFKAKAVGFEPSVQTCDVNGGKHTVQFNLTPASSRTVALTLTGDTRFARLRNSIAIRFGPLTASIPGIDTYAPTVSTTARRILIDESHYGTSVGGLGLGISATIFPLQFSFQFANALSPELAQLMIVTASVIPLVFWERWDLAIGLFALNGEAYVGYGSIYSPLHYGPYRFTEFGPFASLQYRWTMLGLECFVGGQYAQAIAHHVLNNWWDIRLGIVTWHFSSLWND
jgi:hypothetical protein